jgi:tape measure domain-containing protein
MRNLGRETRQVGISARQVAVGYGAWKIADTFRDAIAEGVNFNRVMDAQNVGFVTLLGSEKAAADMRRKVLALALESPLLDPQSAGNSVRSLLAYGIAQKNVISDTRLLGDMAAASGKDIREAMTLGARALGQIESRGALSREELNQLSDSVGLNQKAIRKELGLTKKEFAKTFIAGKLLPSEQALPAIRRAMEKQAKGASELLSETTAGQFQIARERFARRVGEAIRPAYDEAGELIGTLSADLDRISQHKHLDIGEKLGLGRDVLKARLEPYMEDFERFWEENDIGEKLKEGFEEAAPKVASAAGELAKDAAVQFGKTWISSGPWFKLFTSLYLAKKLGVFGSLGGIAADNFRRRFARGGAGGAAGGLANQLVLPMEMDAKKGKAGRFARAGRMAGRAFGAAFVIAAAVEYGDDFWDLIEGEISTEQDLTPAERRALPKMTDRQRRRAQRWVPREERRARRRGVAGREGGITSEGMPPPNWPTRRAPAERDRRRKEYRMPAPPTTFGGEIVVKVGRRELVRAAADEVRQERRGR